MTDVFNCLEARLHTLPEMPTLGQAISEQLCERSKRLEVLNADKIVPRFGADPDDEDGFFKSACSGMLLEEDYWQQCGLTWTWIDERPVWVSPVDWNFDILPDPKSTTNRRFRFTLLGGGQITVIERFRPWPLTAEPESKFYCFHPDLRVPARRRASPIAWRRSSAC